MKIGSLFSGAGGLDMAVEEVFGGETIWHSEIDKAASKVLAYHWPGVPNLGSITEIDWTAVPPVDVLCGGFPCTDVSAAGKRAGLHGTRSGLWSYMAEAIDVLRPRYVVIENVRGLLNAYANRPVGCDQDALGYGRDGFVLRAAGAVLGDISDIRNYDARWTTVSASSVGAPHRRERVFILATSTDTSSERHGRRQNTGVVGQLDGPEENPARQRQRSWRIAGDRTITAGRVDLLPTPRSSDCFGSGQHGDGGMDLRTTVTLLPTPRATDPAGADSRSSDGFRPQLGEVSRTLETSWSKYAPAIYRWRCVTNRVPPEPTEMNKNGKPRLAADFSQWMMGWPDGYVTDPAIGISRNDQLRIIGNGVVTIQAVAALRYLLAVAV